jgi:hypothetical protein
MDLDTYERTVGRAEGSPTEKRRDSGASVSSSSTDERGSLRGWGTDSVLCPELRFGVALKAL